MTPQSIKALLTNCPQICQITDVTKCFAAFIAIPTDLLWYTAQSEAAVSDRKCIHILQSDMKETVVKISTTWCFLFLFKKWPFCKESQRNANQKEQPLISFTLESCEQYYINSNDPELVYGYGNTDFPAKAAIITNVNWKLHIKSQSKSPRTLPFSVMPTPTHFHTFKHMSLMNLTGIHYCFPSREVL